MTFHIGQRITLISTTLPSYPVRPGDGGIIAAVDPDGLPVEVDWDRAGLLTISLALGDRLDANSDEAKADVGRDAVRAAAEAAGAAAADWWAQDTIGARAIGDTAAAARRVLAGIEDGDPAILDALPTITTGAAEAAYTDTVTAPAWTALTEAARTGLEDQFRAAFDRALLDRVGEYCRAGAGDDRGDLAYLRPENLRVGGVGIFAGDWARTTFRDGSRVPVGFVGTLIDTWNGWAVFSCTRQAAGAIVAEQGRIRGDYRRARARDGLTGKDLDRDVDQSFTRMRFDGDTIVADSRQLTGDPSDIQRIIPDSDGRYVVMGWSWCWTAVNPDDCDRIAGTIPTLDAAQEWETLTHVPWTRVGPQQFRIASVRRRTAPATRLTAQLTHGGMPVAAVTRVGAGPAALASLTGEPFDDPAWRAFVAATRHRGQPVTEEQVLDGLIVEAEFQDAVTAAGRDGGTFIRLIDDSDDRVVTVELVQPAPTLWAEVRNLATGLRTPAGVTGTWQIWTGTAWEYLAHAGTPVLPGTPPAQAEPR